MPDQDIVEHSLKQPWKPSYRLRKGGCTPELEAESLGKALAATLRDEGGVPPGLEDLLTASSHALTRSDGARTLAEVTRILEQRFGQQGPVKVLARASTRNLAQIEAGRALPGPGSLIGEYLSARVQHEYFDRVRHRLVGGTNRFSDAEVERRFTAQVRTRMEPHLARLAASLTVDPSAAKLRAPKSSLSRRSTAELIDAPLGAKAP